jgi:hypothetical protein
MAIRLSAAVEFAQPVPSLYFILFLLAAATYERSVVASTTSS